MKRHRSRKKRGPVRPLTWSPGLVYQHCAISAFQRRPALLFFFFFSFLAFCGWLSSSSGGADYRSLFHAQDSRRLVGKEKGALESRSRSQVCWNQTSFVLVSVKKISGGSRAEIQWTGEEGGRKNMQRVFPLG
ncbi:uncharacterized protein CIMG_12841 [Coccidioides immitis RS]|uniref:Transmembrane protein n=1 Tax=Coccidioides immitis (strain RS) TaxID=246410 RepID=A0A0D8JT21_COCIM|nr:uncharacterized protein CIMG_12841 [Coccidioides immitis RS]KJF60269.1 hypothetical protein CIMG_12841 [Coccidioides immitis RS]